MHVVSSRCIRSYQRTTQTEADINSITLNIAQVQADKLSRLTSLLTARDSLQGSAVVMYQCSYHHSQRVSL